MHLLSIIDTSELKRNGEIRTKLTEILGLDVHEEPNVDKSSADGVHMFIVDRMRLPLLIMELKRELGDGSGCDPSTQVGLTMRRSWIQHDVSLICHLDFFLIFAQRSGTRDKCCCPTLMLVGGRSMDGRPWRRI